jgi:endonuclease/exonuclease/phosphatase family metal-dependent hydrolase
MSHYRAVLLSVFALSLLSSGSARAADDLTLVNLNVLHGLGCTPDQCRIVDRVDLLFEWIADAGCPDVVTLQEVIDLNTEISGRQLILDKLATACGGQYEGQTVYANVADVDEEMLLSSHPILSSQVLELHSFFAPGFTRHVMKVTIGHPQGPIDIYTTHLASSADGATDGCDSVLGNPCPAECLVSMTFRECQSVQLVNFVNATHSLETPALITGDFNAVPGSFEYNQIVGEGWIDTHLAAGNPECNVGTGVGCTGGRASNLAELESTADNVDERIDYAFLVPAPPGSTCVVSLDGPGDDDLDGTATRIFADVSNPFASCGAFPSPPCWPSDHEGNEVDLNLQSCTIPETPALSLIGGVLLIAGLLALGAVHAHTQRRESQGA